MNSGGWIVLSSLRQGSMSTLIFWKEKGPKSKRRVPLYFFSRSPADGESGSGENGTLFYPARVDSSVGYDVVGDVLFFGLPTATETQY